MAKSNVVSLRRYTHLCISMYIYTHLCILSLSPCMWILEVDLVAYLEGTYDPRLRNSGLRSKVFNGNCIGGGSSQGLKQRGFCHEALDKRHLDLSPSC